jgi:predicted XRE-type DNA-binding protein
VFADLGFADPEEELTRAQLASRIQQIIKQRRLTQVAAARLMGVDQPKVSALLNGRLANFSSTRLMRLLTTLGQDVEIVVRAKPRNRQHGRIRVIEARV